MNKRRLISNVILAVVLTGIAVTVTTASPAFQSVEPPGRMTYQGHLMDDAGNPVPDGDYVMTFALYDAPTGGALLWGPETHIVDVDDGYFTALLGRDDAIGSDDLAVDTYLEITISGEIMTPRHRLTSVAFALVAGECISATISWDDLLDVPAGFADDVDDDTTYTAGTGLNLAGTTFSIATDYRLPQTCSNGQIAEWNGTTWICGDDDSGGGNITNTWFITGNAGTIAGTHFLGTVDNQPLELRVNNVRALRLEPKAEESPNIIGGHEANNVTGGAYGVVIGGGGGNGTDLNTASGNYATICGGVKNTASDNYSTIAGGHSNTASNIGAVVAGGFSNTASGWYSFIGSGGYNIASGDGSAVPGGWYNEAVGPYSFAAGRRAKAYHLGSFVWGDSTDMDITSTDDNQFIVRASGGITMYTNAAATTGAILPAGSGSWSSLSDRNLKENMAPVDVYQVLHALAGITITTWSYQAQPGSVHIGPMAQDFYTAFGVGESERYISTVDADGVTMAAIQALYHQLLALEARIIELESQKCHCEEVKHE